MKGAIISGSISQPANFSQNTLTVALRHSAAAVVVDVVDVVVVDGGGGGRAVAASRPHT